MGSDGGPPAIALPRLHVIAGDEELVGPGFRDRLVGLVGEGGGRLAVHLRARRMSAARLYEVAKGVVEVGGKGGTLIVVNDRLDVALAVGAGGVHLREDSMGPCEVRGVVGEGGRGFLVGRSIHAPEQAGGGVDYLVLGSVFETASHPSGRSIGPGAVAAAVAMATVPVMAIGGVGVGKVPGLLALGAYGVVVKSGVWGADDPARAVTRYLEVLHEED